jgi:hypothetical protein
VTPTLDDGLRALREAAELARDLRIELTDEYLRRIELVEALPENRSGVDKGSRWRGNPRYWDFARRGHFVGRY